jgi:anti-anti-sigma factor
VANVEVSNVNGPGSALLLSMTGEFDTSNIDVVEDLLTLWLAEGHREAVIDMSQTRFIDSTALAVLVAAQMGGLALIVRGLSGPIREAIGVTRLGEIVTIEPDPP